MLDPLVPRALDSPTLGHFKDLGPFDPNELTIYEEEKNAERKAYLEERNAYWERRKRLSEKYEAEQRVEYLKDKIKKLKEELEKQDKKQEALDHRLYVIEHKEEIERENYRKKNAYQRWIEIPGNENKTELEFVNQLDKKFLKRSGKPLWADKQIKYIVNIYFDNDKNKNFFTGDNEKKFVIYKKIYKRTYYRYNRGCYDDNPYDNTVYDKGYYFICTDHEFKNLYVLDEDGNELESDSEYYEEARKCFAKTIKEMVTRENQKNTKFYDVLI